MEKFGDYYLFDIPAVLKIEIINVISPLKGSTFAEFSYSMFYSIYSIPNIILPMFGGILTDKFGN